MPKVVFISYSSKDQEPAKQIWTMLEERGVSCWIAPRDVRPGSIYSESILDGIDGTVGMILVLSENANASAHVRNEVERAVSRGKAIFPVRIREVEPSRALELFVMSSHWVEAWKPPIEARMDQLAAAIKSLTGTGASQLAANERQDGADVARSVPIPDTGPPSIPVERAHIPSQEELFRCFVEAAGADGEISLRESSFLLSKAAELGVKDAEAKRIISEAGTASEPTSSAMIDLPDMSGPFGGESERDKPEAGPAPQEGSSLAERLQRLKEADDERKALAADADRRRAEAEQRKLEKEYDELKLTLAEQLDREAFAEAGETVAAMLRIRTDDPDIREIHALIQRQLGIETVLIPGSDEKIEMVHIPSGTFVMGSPLSEEGRKDEEVQHEVTISKGFWLGKHTVTKGQWEAVMRYRPRQGLPNVLDDANSPAVWVFWNEVQEFIERLNANAEGHFRLPTEAEWEYACRAGTQTRFCYGDDPQCSQLGQYAWYVENALGAGESYAHCVGEKEPNTWGLYDMHGNVWERCADWYDEGYYSKSPRVDPECRGGGGYYRVVRGGSWGDGPDLRSANRHWDAPLCRYPHIGFRIARDE